MTIYSDSYIPVPTYHSPIDIVTDNDEITVDGVMGTIQEVADNVEYVRQAIGTFEGQHKLTLAGVASRAGIWGYACVHDGSAYESGLVQDVVSGSVALHVEVPIDLPPGTVISNIKAWFYGKFLSASHSSLPAVLPGIKLFSVDDYHGTTTLIADGGPISPADATDYNTGGNESSIAGPYALVAGKKYFIRIEGESGADSVASACRCTGIEMTRVGP